MLSTNLKSFITLRRIMGMLLLCCAQHIAYASEVKPVLTASELSEEQLFLIVMQMASSNYIESEITVEYVEFTHDAWRELLDKRGAAADAYVLKMLNYDIDETTYGYVITSLQCRRGRILADLRKIKKLGPKCDLKYQKICENKDGWKIKVEHINKILLNKDEVSKKYCTTEFYSPEVMQAPLRRK